MGRSTVMETLWYNTLHKSITYSW